MEDSEWSDPTKYVQKPTTRGDRERRIAVIARRKAQLITVDQLAYAGLPYTTVQSRVRSGRLHRSPFPRVFSLSPPPFTRLQTIRAAVLSCGPDSLASHWAAAEVLQIVESPPLLPVHVTRPRGNGESRRDITLHRSVVPPRDRAGADGLLCTSAARTIVDLASVAGPDELEDALIAADSLGILNRRRLDELVARSKGRRGIRQLREAIGTDPVRFRSRTEIAMNRISKEAGVPTPIVNGIVEIPGRRYEVDFHWPSLHLVVEVDGYRFHGARHRANTDRERDQLLTIAGWTVVRFTRDQVVGEPRVVAERLRAVVDRCQ